MWVGLARVLVPIKQSTLSSAITISSMAHGHGCILHVDLTRTACDWFGICLPWQVHTVARLAWDRSRVSEHGATRHSSQHHQAASTLAQQQQRQHHAAAVAALVLFLLLLPCGTDRGQSIQSASFCERQYVTVISSLSFSSGMPGR